MLAFSDFLWRGNLMLILFTVTFWEKGDYKHALMLATLHWHIFDGLFCGPIFCPKQPKVPLNLKIPSKPQADKSEKSSNKRTMLETPKVQNKWTVSNNSFGSNRHHSLSNQGVCLQHFFLLQVIVVIDVGTSCQLLFYDDFARTPFTTKVIGYKSCGELFLFSVIHNINIWECYSK